MGLSLGAMSNLCCLSVENPSTVLANIWPGYAAPILNRRPHFRIQWKKCFVTQNGMQLVELRLFPFANVVQLRIYSATEKEN